MRFEFNPNRPKDRLRNVYFCRDNKIVPLWTQAELLDIFDLSQDGETRYLPIRDLFIAIIYKLEDDYSDIPMNECEIIISSCMGYCDNTGNTRVKTRVRSKTHKLRSRFTRRKTNNTKSLSK